MGLARGVDGGENQGGRAVPVAVRSPEKETGAARPLARRGGRREVPAEGSGPGKVKESWWRSRWRRDGQWAKETRGGGAARAPAELEEEDDCRG